MNNTSKNNVEELSPILKEGDTGEEVIRLQSQLKNLDYYDASITGSFGEYTKVSLQRFQKDNGLNPTGFLDSNTFNALYTLNDSSTPSLLNVKSKPTLQLGSTGPYVTELQTFLTNLLYYTGNIDGMFDTSTQTAVKSFQINNRLNPDGIVGKDTWSALETLYSPLAACESNDDGNNIIYTVVAGDTLYSIARRFNTTVDEIKRLNNLTSNLLSIGQKLVIPNTTTNTITYTVVAGDTLWAIARRFNTTVNEIKRLNNLTSNLLSIGQKLVIPNATTNTITYTVVAGNTIFMGNNE